jgi:hypothetical protein
MEEPQGFIDLWDEDFHIPDRSTMPITQAEFWDCLIMSHAREPVKGRSWWEEFDPNEAEQPELWEEWKPEE